jgi:hypothetical protein
MANLVTFVVVFHNLISAFTNCSNIFMYVNVVLGLAYTEEAEKYISKFYNGLNKKVLISDERGRLCSAVLLPTRDNYQVGSRLVIRRNVVLLVSIPNVC